MTLWFDSGSGRQSADVDSLGAWEVSLLPGHWRVEASSDTCSEIALAVVPAEITAREGEQVSLLLDSGQQLRGSVVDCAGNPVPAVVVRSSECEAASDGNGFFRLPADGASTLEVDVVSIPSGLAPPWWQQVETFGSMIGSRPVFQPTEEVEIVLPQEQEVSFLALDRIGQPLGRVRISIRARFNAGVPWPEGPNYVVRSTSEGSFELENLRVGDYEAWLFPENGGTWPDAIPFSVECLSPHPRITLDFNQGFGDDELVGRTVDTFGNPMPGTYLGVWRVAGGLTFENRLFFHAKAAVLSDSEGNIRLPGLPRGTYLIVRTPSHRPDPALIYLDKEPFLTTDVPGSGFEWIVDAAEPASLIARLHAGAHSVRRTLHLEIISIGPDPILRQERFDSRGECVLQELPPGQARLRVVEGLGEGVERSVSPNTIELRSGVQSEVELILD